MENAASEICYQVQGRGSQNVIGHAVVDVATLRGTAKALFIWVSKFANADEPVAGDLRCKSR